MLRADRGYLHSRLHSSDGGAAQRSGLSSVSTAVGLTDTQEDHAGGQAGGQRQGGVHTEVWGQVTEEVRRVTGRIQRIKNMI